MYTTRRTFLQYSGMVAVAATATPGCAEPAQNTAAAQTTAGGVAPVPAFELDEATIAQHQQWMQSGRHTSRSLTQLYLARIDALDRKGPALRAVLETNPDALMIAADLDAERRAKGPRGPLHGIPIIIKDNLDTADRMTTTAGSLALEGVVASRDAFVVKRLRGAGAVIIAKANLSEWANFRSTHSSSGWSARGGQCRNPYALDHNPCGSSAGTAAALAANYAAAGIGTETDGSIVCPSSANSLVGIKPTVGLVSRSGIVPIAHSQDSAGPMARSVRDATILLGAIGGVDLRDRATREGKRPGDYTRFLDPNGLRGARLGVPRTKLFGYSAVTDRLTETALADMKRLGAEIVDPAELPNVGDLDDPEFQVLLYEFKADLNRYLTGLGPAAPVHSLKEVIDFNERNRDREMPYFGQEIMLVAQAKGPLSEKAYRDALEKNHRLSRLEGIDAVMDRYRLDALVAPTGGPPWPIDLVNGDHVLGSSTTPAAVAGYPSITVPAGYVFGLPVGISFFGRAYSEPTLIKLAYAYEQATKHRRAPRFLPAAELAIG